MLSDLIPGSSYTINITAVAKDNHTLGEPYTSIIVTKPDVVKNLRIVSVTTTSVSLSWDKPEGSADSYIVRWNSTKENSSNKTNSLSFNITNLTPGVLYNISVTAVAGNEGNQVFNKTFTRPEKPQNISVTANETQSLNISWSLAKGEVEYFAVNISNAALSYAYSITAPALKAYFTGLNPGRLYYIVVTSVVGDFRSPSDNSSFATVPVPPVSLIIADRTNSSLILNWTIPDLLKGAPDISFLITYNDKTVKTEGNSKELQMLKSGTLYNITIATVGPQNLSSTAIQNSSYTLPNPVLKVEVRLLSTTSVMVNWTEPQDFHGYYQYLVQTYNLTNAVVSFKNVSSTSIIIENLEPGSQYFTNVTTIAAAGTFSRSLISVLTSEPKAVTGLRNVSETTSIQLTWQRQSDFKSSYKYLVEAYQGAVLVQNRTVEQETYNFTELSPGTLYNFFVSVVVDKVFSEKETISSQTKPAIPSNYLSMANVSATEYHKFTIVVSRDLLNKSSGPITHVGVLLTQSIAGLVLADVCPCVCDAARPTFSFCCCFSEGKACDKAYLTKTYNDRKSGSLEAYLTAVQTPVTGTRSASNLIIDVGTSATWESYVNGELEEGQTYRYALLQHISWMFDGKDSSQHPLSRSAAVRVEDFEAYYQKQKADSNCGFAEEFEDLKVVGTSQAKVHALNPSNKPKNRYNNVLPYDSSRVKLSIIHGDPCDDYINANYMPGYQSKKEFIAAQGPLPGTVNDFWRMIWEKNVRTMVMLTRCNEQGRVKCEQYWASGVKSCGDIIVKTTSDIILDDWTIKDFNIKNVKTAEMRAVRHFHFTAWPDHGVPETTELLISFRHLVREHMDQYSQHSPTVVHCSAGVGRTGTFIAIDRLIFQIERENIVDIFGIVHNLRMHRPLMVQTEDQYVFLNQCALDFIRSRTGNNVDLIYQNTAALSIYENISPKKRGY
uniref:protein-tyrosine-phosphatase n=1 Tax=Oryzias sinensis TaxID=183150 RepID=A0A8C7YEU1_9TELE